MSGLLGISIAPSSARDEVGLVDLCGKEIIPCKYTNLQYLGRGFYLGQELPNSAEKAILTELISKAAPEDFKSIENHELYSPKVLLTRNGKPVRVLLPKDAYLTDVAIPPTQSKFFEGKETAYDKTLSVLPNGSLLFFVSKNGFGVCDLRGKVLGIKLPGRSVLSLDVYPDVMLYKRDFNAQMESRRAKWQERRDKEVASINKCLPLRYCATSGIVVLPMSKFLDEKTSFEHYGRFVLINEQGAEVSPHLAYVSGFSKGVALVGRKEKRFSRSFSTYPGDCYYINADGKAVSAIYDTASPFHGRFALVTLKGSDKQEIGFIDRQFRYTFLCFGAGPYFFHSDHWIIAMTDSPAIVLDSNCREVFRTPEAVRTFLGVPFSFLSLDGKRLYLYVNENGNFRLVRGEVDLLKSRDFPLVLKTEGQDWNGLFGVLGKGGNWLIKPETAAFEVTEIDRAIKFKYGSFNKGAWLNQDGNRLREFYAFLREHNPIGMTEVQLENFLGRGGKPEGDALFLREIDLLPDPNIVSYQLNWFGAGCASSTWFAEFRYDSDRVSAWRIYKRTDREHSFWIRS